MTGLDRPRRRSIRLAYKRPNAGPHRRFTGTLTPIGRIDAHQDMIQLLQTILERITRYRHQTVAGTFVLGDDEGNVYVLAEGANTTAQLVRQHTAWYVGSYGCGDRPIFPSAQDLLDDLRCHFATLAPKLLRGTIRCVEG